MSRHKEQDSRGVGWAPPTIKWHRFELVGNAHPTRIGITLVEMLIAMAITLVMMAAVVTLFANVSDGVRNRRATVELGGQLRHVRNVLQADLANATCPGLTWRRPESNQGYIEIIEGQHHEGNASILVDADPSTDRNWPPTAANPEIDHATSIIPASNLPFTSVSGQERWATDGGGLGDYDDILMLTARNEHEPFVGRVPADVRPNTSAAERFVAWGHETIESPLAEVVWFAVENPIRDTDGDGSDDFSGEPGMRTIYRRALLIAPWINPYRLTYVNTNGGAVNDDDFQLNGSGPTFRAEPGLVRILPEDVNLASALAALIAFQERYDLSVRLEFDRSVGDNGRWRIVANTLGDLTKRENRYEHHYYWPARDDRSFPSAMVSKGSGYQSDRSTVRCYPDPESPEPPVIGQPPYEEGTAWVFSSDPTRGISSYTPGLYANPGAVRHSYFTRPIGYVADDESTTPATARVMLNEEGKVIRVIHGLVPLWGNRGDRRGEDVMLTDALAFDLRVYDPGAPLYGVREVPGNANSAVTTVLEPGDPGWPNAYDADVPDIDASIDGTTNFPFVGQGAYVDLGYGFELLIPRRFFASGSSGITPWFFGSPMEIETTQAGYLSNSQPAYLLNRGALSDIYLRSRPRAPTDTAWQSQLAPGYGVYDTWSFHYENDGLNEDAFWFDGSTWVALLGEVNVVDEGTNGFDDVGSYSDGYMPSTDPPNPRLGIDDIGERETAPPYDRPLRGVQVTLRAYERDSRQIRQATIRQQMMPE